jgi:hypothetical protein
VVGMTRIGVWIRAGKLRAVSREPVGPEQAGQSFTTTRRIISEVCNANAYATMMNGHLSFCLGEYTGRWEEHNIRSSRTLG